MEPQIDARRGCLVVRVVPAEGVLTIFWTLSVVGPMSNHGAWRRAAEDLRANAPQNAETFDLHAKYQTAAAECDRRVSVDAELEKIVKRHLGIPTLAERKSDELDFHNVAAWTLRHALWAAYEAGQQAARKG